MKGPFKAGSGKCCLCSDYALHLLLIWLFINTFYRLSRYHWVRLMNWFNAGLFVVVVPFVYIRIFIWRKNHKESGISEIQRQKRKRSNVVSMWYNIAIWSAEFISLVLAVWNFHINQALFAWGALNVGLVTKDFWLHASRIYFPTSQINHWNMK